MWLSSGTWEVTRHEEIGNSFGCNLALSIFASAAETTTAEVPVTLTVIESQRQISVTVPAALPVSVVDGKVLTASNAAIHNHGKDPVAVTAISVKPGAYDIGSFDHFSGLAGTIALSSMAAAPPVPDRCP